MHIAVTLPLRSLSDVQLASNLAHARNLWILRENPSIPPLYRAGVRWQREPIPPPPFQRVEGFDDPLTCIARGWGDCDDFAPWRSAELVIATGSPDARFLPLAVPTRLGAHVVVWDSLTQRIIEDPSAMLGMPT